MISNEVNQLLQQWSNKSTRESMHKEYIATLVKSFDYVSHKIIIKRLHFYEVCENLNISLSCLQNRKRQVALSNTLSRCGSVYMKDLASNYKAEDICMFVNDATILYIETDMDRLQIRRISALSSAEKWF